MQENEAVIAQAREIYAGVKIFNGLPFYLRRQVDMDTEEELLVQKLRVPTLYCIYQREAI